MTSPQLSIVIPVYNAGKYLDDCIASVLGQDFADIEIICIDDGSTDNSYSILEEWQRKDDRIIILRQKNLGPSAARNAGLKVLRGQFVTFVDADDLVRSDIYTSTIALMEKYGLDMLLFSFESFPDGHKKTFSFPTDKVMGYHELFASNPHIQSENALCFNWRCIFRASVIRSHNLRFHEEVFYGEDMLFNIDAACHSSRIMVSNAPLYLYRKNAEGAMLKPFKPRLEDSLVKAYDLKMSQISEYGLDRHPHYRTDLAEYYIKEFLPMLITNEYNRPGTVNMSAAIRRILSLKMMRESFSEIGFRNIFPTYKAYILYLCQKFRCTWIVRYAYNRVYKK